MLVNLKRLLKKELCTILHEIAEDSLILDAGEKILYGDPEQDTDCRYPIRLAEDVIGWVSGGNKPALAASLLAYLAKLEVEKKSLARDTLEKYREITLLYSLTEKLSKNLDPKEIAGLILDELKRIIKADSIHILTINEETGQLEVLVGVGPEHDPLLGLKSGERIAGDIIRTGKAEILNESVMCAPLLIKDQVKGIINVSSEKPVSYTAEDLKILNALAFQAAFALENSKLNFIRETFGRYLSDDLVNKLLATPSALNLGGEKKEITIMMSDLRGFTSLSEQLSPETVVAIINNFLKRMVDIIQKYNGTILEFIGDAIMAIFGAPLWIPEHAAQAVACALEMQLAMQEVNRWNRENGFPEIQMGVGINTGKVIVGNIGSEKRTKYGCVGSQVNMTARIESYSVGGQVLISQETLDALGKIDLEIREQFTVSPKGIKEPVRIFDIVGLGNPYNLHLRQLTYKMVELREEVAVKVFIIQDKHRSERGFYGRITKLSAEDLEICADIDLPAMTNLKLQIIDHNGLMMIDEIYGKTTLEGSLEKYVLVKLTSVSKDGRAYFEDLLVKAESSKVNRE